MKKLVGGLLKLGVLVAFGLGINTLRGQQADEFQGEVFAQASAACAGDAACMDALQTHFEGCYEDNHSSHRKGRYNREHRIDQEGFDTCLKAMAIFQKIADATDEAEPEALANSDLATEQEMARGEAERMEDDAELGFDAGETAVDAALEAGRQGAAAEGL